MDETGRPIAIALKTDIALPPVQEQGIQEISIQRDKNSDQEILDILLRAWDVLQHEEFNKVLLAMKDKPFPTTCFVQYLLKPESRYTRAREEDVLKTGTESAGGEMIAKRCFSDADDVADRVFLILKREFIHGITDIEDIKTAQSALGICVDNLGYLKSLNILKDMVASENDVSLKEKLSFLGSILLGYDPTDPHAPERPFHVTTQSFYEAFNLGKYEINREAQERDTEIVEKFIDGMSDDGTVVDIGCGTGRITNALATKGRRVIGLDVNSDLLKQAQESDETHTVEYRPGSLTRTGLPNNSVSRVIVTGRTAAHVEKTGELHGNFSPSREYKLTGGDGLMGFWYEINRILDEHGECIFDLADGNKGKYLENKIKMIENLTKLGYFPGLQNNAERMKEVAQEFTVIVDSPDGINFLQRYAPSSENVLQCFRTQIKAWFKDLEIDIYARTPIYKDTNDENVWFRIRRTQSKPAQKTTS